MSATSSPGRVCFYLHTVFNGGVERVYFNLASQLLERGWQVDLVVNNLSGSPFVKQIPEGVRVVDLGVRRFPERPFALARYLGEARPRALLSALHFSNEIAVLARRLARVDTRIIVSEHTTLSIELGALPRWHPRRLGIGLLAPWAYPRADARVAVSRGSAADLAAFVGIQETEVTTVYNPALGSEVARRAEEPIDHPWFAPGQPPVFVGVGRLELQKDFPNLLRAFARVRAAQPCRLVILGVGSLQDELERQIDELGLRADAALLGFRDNPYAYLRRAAAFVLSSAWEGLPTVVLEALAVGAQVVATDCPSGPLEILDGGRYGQLVPVGDSEALARAMQKVLDGSYRPEDPRAWLEQFTVPCATDRYEALFRGEPLPS